MKGKGHIHIVSLATRQSGYSLIEVLIAMVIISVGLLGLASMQIASMNTNQSAYQRSQATVLAYDVADRIRANSSAIGNYLTNFMTLEEAVTAGVQVGCKTTAGCTTAQMAQNDLVEWNTSLAAALPAGYIGTITVDDNSTSDIADDVYTVTVNWDDNRRDGLDEDDPNFVMSFQPCNGGDDGKCNR